MSNRSNIMDIALTSISLSEETVCEILTRHLNDYVLTIAHQVTGVELIDGSIVVTLERFTADPVAEQLVAQVIGAAPAPSVVKTNGHGSHAVGAGSPRPLPPSPTAPEVGAAPAPAPAKSGRASRTTLTPDER